MIREGDSDEYFQSYYSSSSDIESKISDDSEDDAQELIENIASGNNDRSDPQDEQHDGDRNSQNHVLRIPNPCNHTKYPIKVLIRTFLILATKLRKILDNETVEHMTNLIDALIDVPFRYTPLYHFKNIINEYTIPVEVHYLCPGCDFYIGEE